MSPTTQLTPFKFPEKDDLESKGIISALNQRNKFTPDFSELRLYKEFFFLAWGDDRKNHPNSHILNGARYCGKAHSVKSDFIMKETNLTKMPILFLPEVKNFGMQARVRGDLWSISVSHLHLLDLYYGNTARYNRVRTNILVEDIPEIPGIKFFEGMPLVPAFLYVAVNNHWTDFLEMHTRHVNTYTNGKLNGKRFFDFVRYDQNQEYNDEIEEMDDVWGYHGWGRGMRNIPRIG